MCWSVANLKLDGQEVRQMGEEAGHQGLCDLDF